MLEARCGNWRGEKRVDIVKVVQERGRPNRPLSPMQPEVLHDIVLEAHNHGIGVTAHWGTMADLEDVLSADGLEHMEPRGVLQGCPPIRCACWLRGACR
jgi:enamidase